VVLRPRVAHIGSSSRMLRSIVKDGNKGGVMRLADLDCGADVEEQVHAVLASPE